MTDYRNSAGGYAVPKPTSAKRNKARSYKMEVGLAEDLKNAGDKSAHRTPRSGAVKGVGLDGDVTAKDLLVEAKNYTPIETKGGRQVTIELGWLDKVMMEAALQGKPGVVVFQPKGARNKIIVCDWDQFLTLVVKAIPR